MEGRKVTAMKSNTWVFTLLMIMFVGIISTSAVAADPVVLDDDLKEIEARFNAELEKMRIQFRDELQLAQRGPREELKLARARIHELETENARLEGVVSVATAKVADLEEQLTAAVSSQEAVPVARGYLGITIVEIGANQASQLEVEASSSVIVDSVEEGSTASEMGLKPGDAIFEVDGQGASYDHLVAILTAKKVGDGVTAGWARSGSGGVLKVTGRGVLKARREAVETAQDPVTIPAIPLQEPTPVAQEPVPRMKPGITLGVNVLQADDFGLQVTSVESGSNADVAGILVGDVITAVGDARVRTIDGLRDVLQTTVPGTQQTISFIRGGASWVSVVRFGGGDLAAVSVEAPRTSGGDRSGGQGDSRGFLGIVPVERGDSVVVSEVIEGSCADKMGLREGDLLVAVAGKIITSIDVLREALARRSVGEAIEVRYARAGQPHETEGVLGKFPTTEGQSRVIEGDENIARPVASSARFEPPKPSGNGKLGIIVAWDADGAYIDEILPGSGAGSAGAHIGDRIIRVEDVPIGSLEQIGEVLSQTMAGAPVSMDVLRGNDPLTLIAHRNDNSQPQQIPEMKFDGASEPPVLGIEVEQNAIGILLTEIHVGSPAHEAGLLRGDWIIRICDMEVRSIEDIQDALQFSGLLEIQMTIRRDLEIIQVSIPLQRQ